MKIDPYDNPTRNQAVPYGYCQCGCGQKTNIAKSTYTAKGHIKGEPVAFLLGHGAHNEHEPMQGLYKVTKERRMPIQLNDHVSFIHSRRGTRRYLHRITGQVASISDGYATVIDGYRLYIVPVGELLVAATVDGEIEAQLANAGALGGAL